MTPLKIFAQLLGLGGMYMLFSMYQQEERKSLLKRKRLADILWSAHYICLFAWAGAIPNAVGILRESIFMNEEKEWTKAKIWPLVFIAISWTLAIITWKSALSLLPMCASTLVTLSLWVKNPKITKLLTVPVCTAFIVYDVFVGSYAGILNESVSLVSIVISFFKEKNNQCG